LDRVLLSGALGAGDFLLFVDYDFLEVGVAVFTDVFVDRHDVSLSYLSIITGEGGRARVVQSSGGAQIWCGAFWLGSDVGLARCPTSKAACPIRKQ
jgi:hypothetical protein